jgi:hypothetical protein
VLDEGLGKVLDAGRQLLLLDNRAEVFSWRWSWVSGA